MGHYQIDPETFEVAEGVKDTLNPYITLSEFRESIDTPEKWEKRMAMPSLAPNDNNLLNDACTEVRKNKTLKGRESMLAAIDLAMSRRGKPQTHVIAEFWPYKDK